MLYLYQLMQGGAAWRILESQKLKYDHNITEKLEL